MNFNIKSIFYTALVLFSLSSCKQEKAAENGQEDHNETASAEREATSGRKCRFGGQKLHLSQQKFEAMD